jgi:hypothetical protein
MNTYFLCDPLVLVPPPGSSALRILIEVPNFSDMMRPNVILTALEAIREHLGNEIYTQCIEEMKKRPPQPPPPFPVDQRSDVKATLPEEHWTAINGWRVWYVIDDHLSQYLNNP